MSAHMVAVLCVQWFLNLPNNNLRLFFSNLKRFTFLWMEIYMAIMYYLQLKRYHKPPREALQTPREICSFSCCKTKHAIL